MRIIQLKYVPLWRAAAGLSIHFLRTPAKPCWQEGSWRRDDRSLWLKRTVVDVQRNNAAAGFTGKNMNFIKAPHTTQSPCRPTSPDQVVFCLRGSDQRKPHNYLAGQRQDERPVLLPLLLSQGEVQTKTLRVPRLPFLPASVKPERGEGGRERKKNQLNQFWDKDSGHPANSSSSLICSSVKEPPYSTSRLSPSISCLNKFNNYLISTGKNNRRVTMFWHTC